jgi:cell division protein ZapA
MDERHSVRVTIFGNDYTIRGEANAEYILELARYVDEKMREIAGSAGVGVPLKVSILAAINLADEVFRLRANRSAPVAESGVALAPEALSALIQHIDAALKEKP